jgi:hypothetical protein
MANLSKAVRHVESELRRFKSRQNESTSQRLGINDLQWLA